MINNIKTQNILGLRGVVDFSPARASIIAGPNGHGKSSLLEAVRMALLGGTGRVDLKKDLAALVTDGEKKGAATVTTASGAYGLTLPDGKGAHFDDVTGALATLLEPAAFAAIKPAERRSLILAAGGVTLGAADVRAALTERGRDADKIEAVLPMLRSGFAEAAKEAAKRATEAKGAWRGVTGETYGSSKADGWAATAPAFDADLLAASAAAVASMRKDAAALLQQKGQASAKLQALAKAEAHLVELKAAADLEKRRADKLAVDECDLDAWRGRLAELSALCGGDAGQPLGCPCCGAAVIVKGGALVEFSPAAATAEDRKALSAAAETVASLERMVANDRRDLDQSRQAGAEIAAIMAAVGDASESAIMADLAAFDARLMGLDQAIAIEAQVERTESEKRQQAERATTATEQAAAHHADVIAWAAIADDLKPDGIQAALTGRALLPLRAHLASYSEALGWRAVELSDDMEVTADRRAYRLLSESEKWRCDFVLALALARLSGIGLVMADRFDVLDLPGRSSVLDLIDKAAADGVQVIIAGTLKDAPDFGDGWAHLWLGAA